MTETLRQFMVHWNGSAWFVKEYDFFVIQGGLKQVWGKAWLPIFATDIEDARDKAARRYPQGPRKL